MRTFKHELVGGVGLPIAENPGGVMFEAGFRAVGLDWRYILIEAGPDQLLDVVRGMKAMNFRGANFTIPHKVAVVKHLDDLAESARLIGAVNTVRFEGGKLIGENTDGKGFMGALRAAGMDPVGKRVVVLGAGGAARAICVELALAGIRAVRIVNRSAARAEPLVALINKNTAASADYVPWRQNHVVDAETDILINATSIGLYPSIERPDLDYASVLAGMLVCDVILNPPDTAFLQEARKHGATTLDGLGMLVHQGGIVIKMWTGAEAPFQVLRDALRGALSPT